MRVTIVPEDGFVSVDGVGFPNLVFTIDPNIHAVQWYETYGEVEYKPVFDSSTATITKAANQSITDVTVYRNVLDVWAVAKAEAAAAKAAAEAAEAAAAKSAAV